MALSSQHAARDSGLRRRDSMAGGAELSGRSLSIPIRRKNRSFPGPVRKLRSAMVPCCGLKRLAGGGKAEAQNATRTRSPPIAAAARFCRVGKADKFAQSAQA